MNKVYDESSQQKAQKSNINWKKEPKIKPGITLKYKQQIELLNQKKIEEENAKRIASIREEEKKHRRDAVAIVLTISLLEE